MPSKKHSKRFKQVSKMDVLTEALPQQSEKAFRQLVAFVNASEGLTIGFIESNFKLDTDATLEALQQGPTCQKIQFEVLNFPDPQLRFVRDLIVQALQNLQVAPDKKLVLIIRGLEQSIGMTGDYPPMLQDLNFVRDDFVKSIPHPLLFCLPDYAITRLARYASDFWAWKSGLFRFQTSPATQIYALSQTLDSDQIRGSLDLVEKQERIDLLQRLLMEYQPSGHERTVNLKTVLNILKELGVLYRNLGDVVKAEQMFQRALAQITDESELLSIKASVLHEQGLLYARKGRFEEANTLYQQSLEIEERIGDMHGKAATLHQMANIYFDQGQVEKAIALYQQSLGFHESIGDIHGKDATLHQMANIYAKQGQIEESIALCQQSLELNIQIGNMWGKAATLHQMASIYANQGKVEESMALCQQSLELNIQIGNLQGRAFTLVLLGQLLSTKQKDYKIAIQHISEALDILVHLKSPKVEIVQEILFQILKMSPHAEQIQQLLSQSDRKGIQTLIQQIVKAAP
jgi:tetratricopeptide (TPR) repeat protein